MNGCLRDHDALVASLIVFRLLESAFDRAPTPENALLSEQALDTLAADARRCGMVACRRDVVGWAERRAKAYGRAIADGWRN